METVNRRERINMARQDCMMVLDNKSARYGTESEKKEGIMQKSYNFCSKTRGKGTWKIRTFFAVLFFFFVLGMREKNIRFGDIDYYSVQGKLRDNTWVLQAEKVVQTMAIDNK